MKQNDPTAQDPSDANIIKKNELLDSLDLNVGMDALSKLQEACGKKKKSKVTAAMQ